MMLCENYTWCDGWTAEGEGEAGYMAEPQSDGKKGAEQNSKSNVCRCGDQVGMWGRAPDEDDGKQEIGRIQSGTIDFVIPTTLSRCWGWCLAPANHFSQGEDLGRGWEKGYQSVCSYKMFEFY